MVLSLWKWASHLKHELSKLNTSQQNYFLLLPNSQWVTPLVLFDRDLFWFGLGLCPSWFLKRICTHFTHGSLIYHCRFIVYSIILQCTQSDRGNWYQFCVKCLLFAKLMIQKHLIPIFIMGEFNIRILLIITLMNSLSFAFKFSCSM